MVSRIAVLTLAAIGTDKSLPDLMAVRESEERKGHSVADYDVAIHAIQDRSTHSEHVKCKQ